VHPFLFVLQRLSLQVPSALQNQVAKENAVHLFAYDARKGIFILYEGAVLVLNLFSVLDGQLNNGVFLQREFLLDFAEDFVDSQVCFLLGSDMTLGLFFLVVREIAVFFF
jgi:hypothetical protein